MNNFNDKFQTVCDSVMMFLLGIMTIVTFCFVVFFALDTIRHVRHVDNMRIVSVQECPRCHGKIDNGTQKSCKGNSERIFGKSK